MHGKAGKSMGIAADWCFLVLFIGFGTVMGDFSAMAAIVTFLIALIVAAMQNRSVPIENKRSQTMILETKGNVVI